MLISECGTNGIPGISFVSHTYDRVYNYFAGTIIIGKYKKHNWWGVIICNTKTGHDTCTEMNH